MPKNNIFFDETKSSISDDTFYIPLKIHIVRNSDGTGGLSLQKFQKELDTTNYFFRNAKIRFFVCGQINYIDDSTFKKFSAPDEETALVSSTEQPRMLNIYFADTVMLKGNRVCGFSYMPMGPLRTYIDNFCVNRGNTMAHEIGHVFSLIHTHGSSNTILTTELVNGSNCNATGDYICDTPADPNLSDKVSYNQFTKKCTYTGTAQDANGDFFVPLIDNIMSYSEPECMDSFTVGQYERIRKSLFAHNRTDLICTPEDTVIDENKIIGVTPFFTDEFIVIYQLKEDAKAVLSMYDLLGRKIDDLADNNEKRGLIKLYYSFNENFLAQGIYLLVLEVNGKTASYKYLIKAD